jgi:probable phosphoglycerate mutase
VRHGRTSWNAAGRIQGHTDVPLDEVGRDQARQLGEALRARRVRAIACSDLRRARETATIVGDLLGVPVALVLPELRERQLGVFEGRLRDECIARWPEHWAGWEGAPGNTPPGGEDFPAFRARALAALRRVARELARPDAPVLVVSHGGFLRAVLEAVAPDRAVTTVANATVHELELVEEDFRLGGG